MTNLFKTAASIFAAMMVFASCNADKTSTTADFVPSAVSFSVDGMDLSLATKAYTDASLSLSGMYTPTTSGTAGFNVGAGTAMTSTTLSYKSSVWSSSPSVWMSDGKYLYLVAHSKDVTVDVDNNRWVQKLSGSSTTAQSYVSSCGVCVSDFSAPSAAFALIPSKNSYEVSKVTVKCDNPNYTATSTASVTYYYIKDCAWRIPHASYSGCSPELLYNNNGTYVELSSNALKAETISKDTYTSAGVAFLPPSVRAMKVSLTTTIKDSTGAVYKTTTNDKTFDISSYNSPYTAYKFNISYTVDSLGGPVGFTMTATELTNKTASFSF